MVEIVDIASLLTVDIPVDKLETLLQGLGADCHYQDFPAEDWESFSECAQLCAVAIDQPCLHHAIFRPFLIIRNVRHNLVERAQLKQILRTIHFHADCFLFPETFSPALSMGAVHGNYYNHNGIIWNKKLLYN